MKARLYYIMEGCEDMAGRKAKWQNDYIARTYDRVNLTLPKGSKEQIRAHALARGESVNGFIGRAIAETMRRDGERGREAEQ